MKTLAKQKYRVREGRRFQGRQAGETVELDLTEEQEKRYLERGSLEKTTAKDDKKES